MQPGDTHEWSRTLGQSVRVSGNRLLHRSCAWYAGATFIVDLDSSDLCAFHIGTLHFQKIAREVSERWRRESCPGDTRQ
jgi:hypothetical protein